MSSIASRRTSVSVVVPTYNRAKSTIAAVESVLAQTYRPVEVIVVDDGSTDGSGQLLREFTERSSTREVPIVYTRQNNAGPSVARNFGAEMAGGEYIAFLDSDDCWLPEKLERQVRALDELEGCGACVTDAFCIDQSGSVASTFQLFHRKYPEQSGIDHDAVRSLAHAFCGFWISTLLVGADALRRIGGFDPELSFAEDRDLLFRLSLTTPIAYLDVPLARCDRRPSPPGVVCRPWEKAEVRLASLQRMYENWLDLSRTLSAEIRNIVLKGLRATHCDWCNWYLGQRQYGAARRHAAKALACDVTPKMIAKCGLTWIAPALAREMFGEIRPYLS